jgi:hypothetical protein
MLENPGITLPGGTQIPTDEGANNGHVVEQMFGSAFMRGLPADSIPYVDQKDNIKEVFDSAKSTIRNALRIDKGISKEGCFVFVKEDKKRYLTIPSNTADIISKPGWDSLFSLLLELGISMKLSNSEYLNAGASEETRLFFAGFASRISKDNWDSDVDTFIVSGTKPADRGRAMADLYALKKTSSIMNLEKFLPASSKIGETSYIRYYLTLLAGSNRADSLKAIPDILNKVLSNWVDANDDIFEKISAQTKLSIGQVTADLTRKRSKKVRKDGKTIDVQTPIHAARVSGSPFTVTAEEKACFESLESDWNDLEEFNLKYAKGIPVVELEKARDRYKRAYNGQMQFAQATGSYKSRRMEAYKCLAEFSMSSKEMKEFKLTKKTREIALENMVKIVQSYKPETNTVDAELDKILVNMRPHAAMNKEHIWAMINTDMILKLYGFKQPSRSAKKLLYKHGMTIHNELVSYFSTMSTLIPINSAAADEEEDNMNPVVEEQSTTSDPWLTQDTR